MEVVVSTELEASAGAVWDLLQRSESLRFVAAPVLRIGDELPRYWNESGGTVTLDDMKLFGWLPLWRHEMRLVELDDERCEILTEERGGPVRSWRHRIPVRPLPADRCHYTDRVEIEAGALTLAVWLFARIFYGHRQRRWRQLARLLG
jgi:hypothetical protein